MTEETNVQVNFIVLPSTYTLFITKIESYVRIDLAYIICDTASVVISLKTKKKNNKLYTIRIRA